LAVFSAKVYAATVPALPSSTAAAAAAQPPKQTPKPKQHDAQSASTSTTQVAYAPAAHTADATSHAAARKFTAATTFRTVAKETSSTEEAGPAETGYDDTCEL